jgi:hypothetical protein
MQWNSSDALVGIARIFSPNRNVTWETTVRWEKSGYTQILPSQSVPYNLARHRDSSSRMYLIWNRSVDLYYSAVPSSFWQRAFVRHDADDYFVGFVNPIYLSFIAAFFDLFTSGSIRVAICRSFFISSAHPIFMVMINKKCMRIILYSSFSWTEILADGNRTVFHVTTLIYCYSHRHRCDWLRRDGSQRLLLLRPQRCHHRRLGPSLSRSALGGRLWDLRILRTKLLLLFHVQCYYAKVYLIKFLVYVLFSLFQVERRRWIRDETGSAHRRAAANGWYLWRRRQE